MWMHSSRSWLANITRPLHGHCIIIISQVQLPLISTCPCPTPVYLDSIYATVAELSQWWRQWWWWWWWWWPATALSSVLPCESCMIYRVSSSSDHIGIRGTTRRDKIRNEEIRRRTASLDKVEVILRRLPRGWGMYTELITIESQGTHWHGFQKMEREDVGVQGSPGVHESTVVVREKYREDVGRLRRDRRWPVTVEKLCRAMCYHTGRTNVWGLK